MDRTVPTLLGIMIILMVAALVVLIYDFKVTYHLAAGHTMVGTVGGRMLSLGEQPAEDVSASEAQGEQRVQGKRISPALMPMAHGKRAQVAQGRRRAQHRAHRGETKRAQAASQATDRRGL